MKSKPYNTGKIKIGHAYERPLREMHNPDQDWVQEAFKNQDPINTTAEYIIIGLFVAVLGAILIGVI
jgi:CHASE3 domain sensor protein